MQHCGGDHSVVMAAKVSTDPDVAAGVKKHKKDSFGLINYLMKHRHGTPFEHAFLTFYVHAPIFVWREWHRHRVQSYNEESARYKILNPVFYIPPPERPMFKVPDWKPGRPKFMTMHECLYPDGSVLYMEDYKKPAYQQLVKNLKEVYALAYKKYKENLALDVDPGLARDCLPVGIYSSCWVSMNPRSLMAFLSLRTHDPESTFVSYPLYEIEVAARQVEKVLKKYFPLTHKAFVENGRVGP